jgi:teichuronic acid biosynthesis glycosyltransferase TuaG
MDYINGGLFMCNPLISIVTPTYNRAHLLSRVWDSIKNQTYEKFEWIVVDDASTDNTYEFIKNINDNRVKYIKLNKNTGVNVARNNGIRASKGNYIMLLDSDDHFISNDVIEKMVKIALNTEDNIGVIAFRYVDNKENKVGYMAKSQLILNYIDILSDKKVNGDFFMVIKKHVFDKHLFDEDIRGVESLTWLRISKEYNFMFNDIIVAKNPQDRDDNLTSINNAIKNADNLMKAYERLLEENKEALIKYCPNKYGFYKYVIGYYSILSGNTLKAYKYYLSSLVNNGPKLKVILLVLISWMGKNAVKNIIQLRKKIKY